jgi:hypothetical protein
LRLRNRQTASAYVVSVLSLFIISISILPNIYALEVYQNQILLGSSITLSAFVIFTSLIDNSQNFFHQGELLHDCGRRVATVYHELKNLEPKDASPSNWKKLRSLQDDYRAALDACPVNHGAVDFLKVQVRKPEIFKNDFTWKWQWGEVRFKKALAFLLTWFWLAPHLIAMSAVGMIIWLVVLSDAQYVGA